MSEQVDVVTRVGGELPVDPVPTGLYDDRRELWYCCTGIVNSHEAGNDLKQMALGIRQQLRLEARVNELTELFYAVKADRDECRRLLAEAVPNCFRCDGTGITGKGRPGSECDKCKPIRDYLARTAKEGEKRG